jgi:integrase
MLLSAAVLSFRIGKGWEGRLQYYYDINTRAFLGHNRSEAEARVRGNTPPGVEPDTIAGLIARYKASPAFLKLKPGTQALYNNYLGQIKSGWGDMRAKEIRPATIEDLKDHLQDQPSKCNMILALFRILLRLAVRLEFVPSNVASRPGRIEETPRTTVWSVGEEQRFLANARPSLQLAFMLLLFTVQRPSDVLEMTAERVTEREGRMFIAVRQQKTKTLLDVPVHHRLEPLVRQRLAQTKPSDRLVASPHGLPWSRRNFSRGWDAAMKKAGLEGLQRRDLRRTGIVRLAEAGATTPMIAAISGHGIDYCQSIVDTYLPRRTEVAVAAIELWERTGTRADSAIVQIASKRKAR